MTSQLKGGRPGKTATVRAFMAAHPGQEFTPAQVAAQTGLTTFAAAGALLYLSDQGQLLRKRLKGRNGPGSVRYQGLAVIASEPKEGEA